MTTKTLVITIFAAFTTLLVTLVVILGLTYVKYANLGNAQEKALSARMENNKNIYGQYGQTILEMAQVPAQRQKDVLKLIVETMEGRYGEDGSRAVFQMIQEQNPTAGDELYVKIQQQIQSGRAEFKTAQSVLLDQKAAYEILLGNVWSGFWMGVAGYPKIDLTQIRAVSTVQADAVFEQGKEAAPIQIFGNN